MLLPSGTAVSKCCGAVMYEHDDRSWRCMKCFQPCEAAGTLGDLYAAQNRQRELEHSLATTFVTLQREKNPAQRTRMWSECLRLAAELEKLNDRD